MNILIISTNRNLHPMPVVPLGACLVAQAASDAGHHVLLLDLMFARNPPRSVSAAIREFNPDLVGISVRNIDNNDMEKPVFYLQELPQLIENIRRLTGAPIVLGGAAVSVMPEEILRFSGGTCAVCGDGDLVFPELINNLTADMLPEDLPGLAWLEDGIFRLNSTTTEQYPRSNPLPDLNRWLDLGAYRRRLTTIPLQTKLGCHYRCNYCTYNKIEGRTYRMIDPEKAVDAVARLESMGLRDIELVDNVFNSPRHHALAFCEGLARLRHDCRLQSLEINPASLDDDLLVAMEKAGFAGIGITAESASEPVLAGLNKGFTVTDVHQAAEAVSRHELPCLWIFLFGGPGETPETVQETLDFAKNVVRPRDVAFFNTGIRVYPGTGIEDIARRQGVLDLPPEKMLEPVFYVSPEVEVDWIRAKVKEAMAIHLNFINGDSINLPFLPALNFLGKKLGLRPPLWKHSRKIRRGLRMMGMEA